MQFFRNQNTFCSPISQGCSCERWATLLWLQVDWMLPALVVNQMAMRLLSSVISVPSKVASSWCCRWPLCREWQPVPRKSLRATCQCGSIAGLPGRWRALPLSLTDCHSGLIAAKELNDWRVGCRMQWSTLGRPQQIGRSEGAAQIPGRCVSSQALQQWEKQSLYKTRSSSFVGKKGWAHLLQVYLETLW